MQYTSGRRNTYGSSSATGSVSGANSRLSVPNRTSTRSTFSSSLPSTGGTYVGASPARYSSAYSTPSPNRPSTTAYSRYSSATDTAGGVGSKYRSSRYDSHYSTYGKRSSDVSPATTRPYVTASSGVSTSRESSLSSSWPSPARNLITVSNLPRYDASVRSSSSTVAAAAAARRRSPIVVGGSVPAIPSSTNYSSGIESRRGSTRSYDLSLNRTPSSSTLHSQISSRRYLGSGSGVDGNFDAGRAESLYRPSTKYTASGSNRYLTSGASSSVGATKNYDLLLDTVGGGSTARRASVLSTSSSVRASSMSSPVRAVSRSPGPASKTLWNKQYNSLVGRWAEQTGSSLNSTATGKNQYSYRPVIGTKMPNANGTLSDGSIDTNKKISNPPSTYTRRSKKKNKEESDGYDSSSSSDNEPGETTSKPKSSEKSPSTSKSSIKSKKTVTTASVGTTTSTGVNRRRANAGTGGTGTNNVTSTGTSTVARRQKDGQLSSSDNETVQDSLDARIKARRKRLQKSKAMLQEHKEDGWNYRRTLQIEESKQRQQTSAAATISYTRIQPATTNSEFIKRDDEEPSVATTSSQKLTTVEPSLGDRKRSESRTRKSNEIERSTPSKSIPTLDTPLDENASGLRAVQKVYLQPLQQTSVKNESMMTTTQSDHGGDESTTRQQIKRIHQIQNEQRSPRQSASLSMSPAPTPIPIPAVNGSVKKLLDEEKNDFRRSPMLRASPMSSNRGISNERTPPPPISQRQDFNYNEYVSAIAPKQINYENPTAALIEADHEQQMKDLPKGTGVKNTTVKDEKGPPIDTKSNKPSTGDQIKITVKTKPIRTLPPSVVIDTAVSPPSTKRIVNNSRASPSSKINNNEQGVPSSNSLNSIPTPFRRNSPSPIRVAPDTRLTPSRSNEKLISKSHPPLPPSEIDDDERKRNSSVQQKNNYVVHNGEQKSQKSPRITSTQIDRNTPTTTTITVVPMNMIPAKCVPEKITPTFTPVFNQPPSNQNKNPSHGFAAKLGKISVDREEPTIKSSSMTKEDRSRENTPLSIINNQRSTASGAAQMAEIELKKQQRKENLKKESMIEMHRLPSVDREMLNLLTLGEELNNSRSSLTTTGTIVVHPNSQQSTSKFAQSFRTAMPQKGVGASSSSTNLPLPPAPGGNRQPKRNGDPQPPTTGSCRGSRESLNSFSHNTLPKPWRPSIHGSREGSSESLASSFATATSTNNQYRDTGSKDSLNFPPAHHQMISYKDSHLNVYPKPWSKKDKLSTSAEPLATVAETPGESAPIAPPRTHYGGHQRNTNSLELATKKVDEMLRLAKLKHQQQQRREKIVLLQSQTTQPRPRPNSNQNLTLITQTQMKNSDPISDASRELDKAYEAIQLDYAEAQESRQKHLRRRQYPNGNIGSISDNENIFMRPQLITVFSTVHMPAHRSNSGDEMGKQRRMQRKTGDTNEKYYLPRGSKTNGQQISTSEMQTTISNNGPYDHSKFDYTKRWLEGDLKSLTRDTKPDLLQFGSAPRLDFDQRSVGSASAEVAAITNKDRLQSMRAVPDLVPQNQNHQSSQSKHHLVKPSPVVAGGNTNKNNFGTMQPPIQIGNFLGPKVGQAGSKSSSFAGGLPSLNQNGRPVQQQQHPGQRHQNNQQPQPRLAQPDETMHYNSGGIRQAVDHLRASAESLPRSDRSWAVPKDVSHGHVRKNVDLFDRMSDNDSELSFRSADNVAYRSALYKPSRRLSLTDHMAHFVRRFESDEESNGGGTGGGQFYRRMHKPKPNHDLHSDDEVRLAVLRNSNSNAPYYRRALANSQSMAHANNGAGSTQSLPVIIPSIPFNHPKMPNGNFFANAAPPGGRFNQVAPHSANSTLGQQHPSFVAPARSVGFLGSNNHDHHRMQQQASHRKIIPPWLRGQQNRTSPAKQHYWSSNSTLTDLEAPGVSQFYHHHGSKLAHSNDTMQAVDSLVAELELNTDHSGSIISQRSTNNFPVDRYYYHQHQSSVPIDIDRSSSRSKLNAIPEQHEHQQQNPMDGLHLAQKRLEEARRDLKNVAAVGTRRQMSKEKPHGLLIGHDSLAINHNSLSRVDQEKPMPNQIPMSQNLYVSTNFDQRRGSINQSNSSLPRSVGGPEKNRLPINQEPPQAPVRYRQNKSMITNRPASYAAPGVQSVQVPSNSMIPRGSAEHLGTRKYSLGREQKDEDNYDNVVIGVWRQRPNQPPPVPPPRSKQPSNLHSPNVIKIGNIVLGRGDTTPPTNDQSNPMTQSKIEKQMTIRNPLKNFFQLFSKNQNQNQVIKSVNNDQQSNFRPQPPPRNFNPPQRSPSTSSNKAPSTLSLNIGPSEMSSNGQRANTNMTGSVISTLDGSNHFHKSQSTNDAYTLKPIMTQQEMRQLDELLTSFHEDGNNSNGSGGYQTNQKIGGNVKTKGSGMEQGVKQESAKQTKSGDKNNTTQEPKNQSKFRLGLPAFWKRA